MKNWLTNVLLVAVLLHAVNSYHHQPGNVEADDSVDGLLRSRGVATSLSAFIVQCWTSFLRMMPTGIPDLAIPAFDPWSSKCSIPFRLKDSYSHAIADFNATSLESVGFSSASTTVVEPQTSDQDIVIQLVLSDLIIKGQYKLVGTRNYIQPIFGNGPFHVCHHNLTAIAIATLSSTKDQKLHMMDIKLDHLNYRTFSADFDNLTGFGDDRTSRSNFISILVKMLWPQIEQQLRVELSKSLTEYFNQQIKEFIPASNTFILVDGGS